MSSGAVVMLFDVEQPLLVMKRSGAIKVAKFLTVTESTFVG
jgi:hypothetical protein